MTLCPRCSRVNPDQAKFCGACGAPLATQHTPIRIKTISDTSPNPQGTCFYHPDILATTICSKCGRATCSDCSKPYGTLHFCPECHWGLPPSQPSGSGKPTVTPPTQPSQPPTAVATNDGVVLLKLSLLSVLMGILGAFLLFVFVFIEHYGIELLWEDIPHFLGIKVGVLYAPWVISMCLIGGLLVGCITRISKVPPLILAQEIDHITKTGRMGMVEGIVPMVRGLVGILFGGSIGPEGPLVAGCAAIGTWFAETAKLTKPEVMSCLSCTISGMFGGFLDVPFGWPLIVTEGGLESGKLSWKVLLPTILAGAVGAGLFYVLTGAYFMGTFKVPPVQFNFMFLIYAFPLGLVGALLGILFVYFFNFLKRFSRPREIRHAIELALLAGLNLGVVASFFPLVLFDGGDLNVLTLATLIANATAIGAPMLVAYSFMKLSVTVVCLTLGWAGGLFFPAFFIGGSMGLAINLVFPFIPIAICMPCVMVGVVMALAKFPITLTLVIALAFGLPLTPVVAVAAVTAFIFTYGVHFKFGNENEEKGAH